MSNFNIQKHLLTLHLGLRGVDTELLDTFPTKSLLEKSDTDVCVSYRFIVAIDALSAFNDTKAEVCSLLSVEASSFEKIDENAQNISISLPVFYSSVQLHWSDQATLDFESLTRIMSPHGIRISLNVSISN